MFENGVTVTFNAEGGKLNGMDKWIEEIAEENGAWNINLADFVPEREGYDFLGWGVSSSAADTTVLSADDLASSDAALRGMQFSSVNGGTDYTLYAKWQNATGFDYLYDEDTKELTITNDQGMNVFYEAMTEKQLKEVEKLVMLEGVSDLGSFDFSVMTSLKTLMISPGIKRITDGRFQNMPSLEQVVIPASVTMIFSSAFADCPKLKTVSFENNEADPIKSVDNLSIEENAFARCNISEIHFPRQLYSLGSRVFEGCPLTDVYFQEARFSSSQYINLADTNYSAYGSFDLAGAAVKLHFPESIADAYKEKVIPNYAQIINPPEDFIRYPVSVNGETFHSQRLEIPCGEGYAAFDPLTTTLTLHDADITVGNSIIQSGLSYGDQRRVRQPDDHSRRLKHPFRRKRRHILRLRTGSVGTKAMGRLRYRGLRRPDDHRQRKSDDGDSRRRKSQADKSKKLNNQQYRSQRFRQRRRAVGRHADRGQRLYVRKSDNQR